MTERSPTATGWTVYSGLGVEVDGWAGVLQVSHDLQLQSLCG